MLEKGWKERENVKICWFSSKSASIPIRFGKLSNFRFFFLRLLQNWFPSKITAVLALSCENEKNNKIWRLVCFNKINVFFFCGTSRIRATAAPHQKSHGERKKFSVHFSFQRIICGEAWQITDKMSMLKLINLGFRGFLQHQIHEITQWPMLIWMARVNIGK